MKYISSRENADFKAICRLAQSGRERRRRGQTLLDGVHLIEAYEAAVGPVEALVVNESLQEQPEIAALVQGRPGVLLSHALYQEAAVVDTPSGIMAIATIPGAEKLNFSRDTIILDGVQDPGNVGTLLRTAAAAGFRQALLSSECAGAWSPKVLRAGQGAHFQLSIHENMALQSFLADFQGVSAVTALTGSTSLYDCDLCPSVAWVFGSEGQGVSPELLASAKLRVKIPMPGAIESLNVAAAAAVCLFETVRQRTFRG